MEKDFHYYCTGVLARAAGFTEQDALTIAYASQYVDDAMLDRPLRFGEKTPQDIRFDPVRTQHTSIKSLTWRVQKLIFMPFHFIPPEPFATPGWRFTYITEKNSKFARLIFAEACDETHELLRMCRIGVAVHTLADTWAHRGFSGRSHQENSVVEVNGKRGNIFVELFNRYLHDTSPNIGHADAFKLPDLSHQRWSFRKKDAQEDKRYNPTDFLESAQSIYDLLLQARKDKSVKPIPWTDIQDKIQDLFEEKQDKLEKKCDLWEKAFSGLFTKRVYHYDDERWKDDAFELKDYTIKDLNELTDEDLAEVEFKPKPTFFSSPWYHFHQAARIHQFLVIKRLP
jgi:hypothetical protein